MSVGAIAMNLSTIIVALNAQLLRRGKTLDLEDYAGFLASAQNTMTFAFCDRETISSLLWNFAGT
jgi:hypothetical protein